MKTFGGKITPLHPKYLNEIPEIISTMYEGMNNSKLHEFQLLQNKVLNNIIP